MVTWCVHHEGELWCANAFYLFDAQKRRAVSVNG
ncbi:hypothetical protein SEEH1831_22671 [Salmonella enterica subsp. enterica serovar Heidelberg str. 77-1831]|nr:hypothetical protein SEEH1831_22671 [Salmonella enterica subsp. enterica serovar Heidelberg str. 77-1831]